MELLTPHRTTLAASLAIAACLVTCRSRNTDSRAIQFRRLTHRGGYVIAGRFSERADQIFYSAAWDGSPVRSFEVYPNGAAAASGSAGEPSRLPTWLSENVAFTLSGELRGFGQMGFVEPGDIFRPPSSEETEEWSDESRISGRRVVVRRVGDEDWLEAPPGRVLYETPGWISDPRYSPDGQTLAFLSHRGVTDSQGTVAFIDVRGAPRVLPGLCTTIGGLAWPPSGREVWFTASCDTPGQALYAATLNGEKRLLASFFGSLRLLDISRGARALLARDSVSYGLTILGPKPSEEADLPWQPRARNLRVSSDGELVAYDLPDPAAGSSVFVRRRRDGWQPLRVAGGVLLDLSADGRRMLIKGDRINPVALSLLNLDDGSTIDLSTGGFQYISGGFLPGTDRIHFLAGDRSGTFRIYAQRMDRSLPEPISPDSATDRGCPSPDGQFVIGRGPDRRNYLYPVSGGDPRPLPGLEGMAAPLQWTVDGKGLYLTRPTEVPARVWLVPAPGGREALYKAIQPANRVGLVVVKTILISPDAKTIAFTYTRTTSDLFVADGIR